MKNVRVIFGLVAILLCAQFGDSRSKQGKEKPDVNLYGSLVDTNGKRTQVENITINGRIHDIPVYARPADEDINPDVNTTRLNLADICEIKTISHKTYTFSKREYVEIQVFFSDTKRSSSLYIIDKRRKVFCDAAEGGAEMEVTFQAISRLVIQGLRPQLPESKRAACLHDAGEVVFDTAPENPTEPVDSGPDKDDHEIDLLVTRTNALIENLEEKAHKLPADSKENRSIKTSILGTIKNLKDSVKSLFS